jgi:hypothetical protein
MDGWKPVFFWFPSSCKEPPYAKLRFTNDSMSNIIRLSQQEVPKQSLGHKCVPKQELGNES